MEDIALKKPSFFNSMMSGINGYVKGLLAGGIVGIIAGGIIGAVVGAFSPDAGAAIFKAFASNTHSIGEATGILASSGIAAGAAGAAALGGLAFASVGSLAGTVTGVVRSREAVAPSAQDVMNVAKITFAQGVTVGHNLSQAQSHQAQEEVTTKWRDRIAQQRGNVVPQPPVVN